MADCIFCQIIKGKITSRKIYETEDLIAINDIEPQAPVHVLLIPKKHIESVAQAKSQDQAILGKLLLAAKDVAAKLKVKDAFQLKVYSGKDAGQTVFHLHIHLLGGFKKPQVH